MTARQRRRGSYGVDAPPALLGLVGAAIGLTLVGIAVTISVGIGVGWVPVLLALGAVASCAVYLHTTLRGKFLVWSELLDELDLHGDERLLDLGCGRGAVLLMAASRLTTGRAVGVDLWRTVDQSGNALDTTRRNAAAEGVQHLVELHTADMTALPFGANEFDVIVSSMAIHNIKDARGRVRAIDEAMRVLRPAGRLVITDFRADEYRRRLTELDVADIRGLRLGWRMWWGGPWVGTRLVAATKNPAIITTTADMPTALSGAAGTSASADAAPGASITTGQPESATIAAGQLSAQLAVDLAAGQKYSVTVADNTIEGLDVVVRDLPGSRVASAYASGPATFIDTFAAEVSGRYDVVLATRSPAGGSAVLTVHHVPEPDVVEAAVGGPPVTVTIAAPGQRAVVSFTGHTNRWISIDLPDATVSWARATLHAPDGSELIPRTMYRSPHVLGPLQLPTTGTYTLTLDPDDAGTGHQTIQLHTADDGQGQT